MRFGHLGAEMFRACRLVVDTGIHALGWSQERAVKFMMEHNYYSERMIRWGEGGRGSLDELQLYIVGLR